MTNIFKDNNNYYWTLVREVDGRKDYARVTEQDFLTILQESDIPSLDKHTMDVLAGKEKDQKICRVKFHNGVFKLVGEK